MKCSFCGREAEFETTSVVQDKIVTKQLCYDCWDKAFEEAKKRTGKIVIESRELVTK